MPVPPIGSTTILDPTSGLPLPWVLEVKNSPTDGFCGTATPPELIQVSSANGSTTINGIEVEELPDSPTMERAEQATCTKKFKTSYVNGITLIDQLGRGTILADTGTFPFSHIPNLIRVLSATIQREPPEMCTVTVVAEGISFDLPPDEFACTPVELGINIVKHPRYFYSLDPQQLDNNGEYIDTKQVRQVKQAIIRAIQTYQDSPFFPSADNLNGLIQNGIITSFKAGVLTYTTPATTTGLPVVNIFDISAANQFDAYRVNLALLAAMEIIQKLWRSEDNPYLVGFQITWSVYYYRPPALSPGGYIQNPISETGLDNPGLPDYFYSPNNPPKTNTTIFDDIPQFNAQCYSNTGQSNGIASISWLRKADDYDYQRTWFKVTRTWIGSAIGAWDTDIFSQFDRPGTPSYPQYPYGYVVSS